MQLKQCAVRHRAHGRCSFRRDKQCILACTNQSAIKEKKELGKTSLGITITQHRLQQLIDASEGHPSGIEIQDLINEEGHNSGTCVYIKIPAKEM